MGIYHITVAGVCLFMYTTLNAKDPRPFSKEPLQGFLTLNGRKVSPLWDEEDQCLPPKKLL